MRDCKDCPSFLHGDADVAVRFGRRLGVPMCARFGHVLGSPQYGIEQEIAIRSHFANGCSHYGESLSAVPSPMKSMPFIAAPDQSILEAENEGKGLTTCNACKNAVKQSVVNEQLGFPLALCKAYGKLIFQPMEESKNCSFSSPGAPSTSVVGVTILPPYRRGFTVSSDVAVNAISEQGGGGVHDPRTYATDKPVSDEDIKRGIRAWRKVTDPEGEGPDLFLPIWSPDRFTAEEQIFIPQLGSREHPELYVDYAGLLYQFAVDSWELDETLCLVGAPGLGKTEFGRWVAFLMQVPFHRFSFHKSSDVDDMIGKMKFETSQGTYWVDGRVTKAYKSLCIEMLDELNLSPEECKEVLRSMMDNSSQLVLDQDEGVVVTKEPDMRLLISINPPWDPKNLGASEFADAEVNRMSFSYVGWPPEAVERHIIKSNCALDDYDIPDELVTQLIQIGKDLREAADQGTFPGSWGIRQQIKVARKTKFYGLTRAYKQASLNYYDPRVTEELLRIIATSGSVF